MTDLDDSISGFLDELDVVPSADSNEPEATGDKDRVDAATDGDSNGKQGSAPAVPKESSTTTNGSKRKPSSKKSSEMAYSKPSGLTLYERSMLQREEKEAKVR